MVFFLSQHVIDEFVEVRVVRKNNVTALIPHEAMLVDVRTGMAADVIGFFVERPIFIPEFVKPIGCTQSCWSGADDDNFLVSQLFPAAARGLNRS